MFKTVILNIFSFLFSVMLFAQEELVQGITHGYAQNGDVRIHYVTKGEGPVMIMVHGFPDFWYSWRHLIKDFSKDYKVVAIDLRGYNLSDAPSGVENYSIPVLVTDLVAVIDQITDGKVTLVSNDWGGIISWIYAFQNPHRVERFIACNVPHPVLFTNFLAQNPKTGSYTNKFKEEGAEDNFTPEILAKFIPDESAHSAYIDAFGRSGIKAMLNYYKASYPSTTTSNSTEIPNVQDILGSLPKVQCPVLMIHGLQDTAFPSATLNYTWEGVTEDFTLYTIHDGGHFIQQEKPGKVIKMIRAWFSTMD